MRYFLIPIVFLCLMACKNSEKANKEESKLTNLTVDSDSICRFQVSFISIGSGPDRPAKQKFNDFISDFNKLNNLNITPKIVNWGREGEQDYCFKLEGIKTEIQEKFISDSKLLFTDNNLVKSFENMPYRHKSND
jgi:hypothetical protein